MALRTGPRTTSRTGRLAGATVVALALAVTAACGSGEQPASSGGAAPAAQPLRFGFNWTHDIEWAAYYLAEKNGDFTRNGVDVQLVGGGENTPAVAQEIAAGQVDMGVSSDELQIINANKEGGDFVVIAATYQRSPYGLTWLNSKPITSPADLVGKKIGGQQGEQPRLDAVFKANHLPVDYTFVPMSYDPQPLVAGDMDVITSYTTNQTIALAQQGVQTTAITFSDFNLPSYGDLIFASRSYLDAHRDTVVGFLRGLLAGVDANVKDPAAGVQVTLDEHGADAGIDPALAKAGNPAYISLLTSDYTKAHGLLAIDPQFMADKVFAGYTAAGETNLPPVSQFVDMSFLEAAKGS
jgi:ABC-type nitrate/sulfonate/bicarbonate transport system substrate-binding protein